MKKVVLVVEAVGGGVRKHIIDLINGLNKEKFSITLIYGVERTDLNFVEFLEGLDSNVTIIPSKYLVREINLEKDFRACIELFQRIKKINPDIVHCHSSKAGVIGRIVSKVLGIKRVFYTPHAYSFQASEFGNRKRKLFILIERIMSRLATNLTFNVSQEEMEEALTNKIDKQPKFRVIQNGINSIEFPDRKAIRDDINVANDIFLVGNIARIDQQKNPLMFLEIACEVVKNNKQIHFVYIGEGPLKNECQKYIVDNNLSSNVHMLGYKKNSELIVKAFDLFLTTSQYEGLPYSLIESLRAGIPIIGTNVVGHKEIVTSDVGYLFEPTDKKSAVDLIIRIAKKNEFHSEKIQKEFNEKYLLSKMLEKIEYFYTEKF